MWTHPYPKLHVWTAATTPATLRHLGDETSYRRYETRIYLIFLFSDSIFFLVWFGLNFVSYILFCVRTIVDVCFAFVHHIFKTLDWSIIWTTTQAFDSYDYHYDWWYIYRFEIPWVNTILLCVNRVKQCDCVFDVYIASRCSYISEELELRMARSRIPPLFTQARNNILSVVY